MCHGGVGEEHPLWSTKIFSVLYCLVVTVYTIAKTHWNSTFKICLTVVINKNKFLKVLNLSTIYGLFQRKWNTWVIYLNDTCTGSICGILQNADVKNQRPK